MEQTNSIKTLNIIDDILLNRKEMVTRKVGDEYVEFKEDKYSAKTISNLVEHKADIISDLIKSGLVSIDEQNKYWLSDDYSFTPKINEGK
jgi:flagellar biosynthesis/type III secretory pathway chaperone